MTLILVLGSLQEAGVLEQKTFVSTVLDIVVQCCECSQTKESQMRTLWSIVSEPSLLLLQGLRRGRVLLCVGKSVWVWVKWEFGEGVGVEVK